MFIYEKLDILSNTKRNNRCLEHHAISTVQSSSLSFVSGFLTIMQYMKYDRIINSPNKSVYSGSFLCILSKNWLDFNLQISIVIAEQCWRTITWHVNRNYKIFAKQLIMLVLSSLVISDYRCLLAQLISNFLTWVRQVQSCRGKR